MTQEHTPWTYFDNEEGDYSIAEGSAEDVGMPFAISKDEETAQRIVQAVNAHDALVAALEAFKKYDDHRINKCHWCDSQQPCFTSAGLWDKARELTVQALTLAPKNTQPAYTYEQFKESIAQNLRTFASEDINLASEAAVQRLTEHLAGNLWLYVRKES